MAKSTKAVSTKKDDDRTNVLGVGVDSTTMQEVLEKIEKEKLFVVTVNPEFVMLAQDDLEFKKILNNADLAIADGVGLKLAGIKNIIPGRKLIAELLKKPYKFFLFRWPKWCGRRNGQKIWRSI